MTRARWFRLAATVAMVFAVVAFIAGNPTHALILVNAWLVALVGEDVAHRGERR